MSITAGSIIGGVSAIGNLLSNLIGSENSSKFRDENEKIIKSRRKKIENLFSLDNNTDYLDTTQAVAALSDARENLKNISNKINSNAIKTGKTNEQKIAEQQIVNKGYADTIKQLATAGEIYKNYIRNNYLRNIEHYDRELMNINDNNANSLKNSGVNIGNSIGNIGDAIIDLIDKRGIKKS